MNYKKEMINKYPPLWVWLICTGLMLALLFYLQLTTSIRTQLLRQQQYTVFKQQMDNFLSESQANTNQCRVVCWGSSMTRQAIENSDVMRQQTAYYGKEIDVQKFYLLGANNSTFPYLYELFEATAQLAPQLICIEDNIFSHTKEIRYNKFEKELKYWLTLLEYKTPDTRKLSEFENKHINFDTHDIRFENTQQKDTSNIATIPRSMLNFSDNKKLNEQLQFVLDQNIPIVVLNIPRVGKVQKQLIKPDDYKATEEQIRQYRKAGFQIEYWRFPRYLSFSYFNDYTHMNKEGRAVYSKWLSEKIAQKLSASCQ